MSFKIMVGMSSENTTVTRFVANDEYYTQAKEKENKYISFKPDYYRSDKSSNSIDVISICKLFNLNFNLGNVLKYIVRAGKKNSNTIVEDLKKAQEYLRREIEYFDTKKEDED